MSLARLSVMYGHLEGGDVNFARDPSGYLSIEAGIYRKHGLEVSWDHVQGTEERYRRLESGAAEISFVVGRASLQHFLDTGATCILGCPMNSCPYYLIVDAAIRELKDLKGKVVACREGAARRVPFAQVFEKRAGLKLASEVTLQLLGSDLDALNRLIGGQAHAALLPRPYGFMAEERGFERINQWPAVVDDPLPITLETTRTLAQEKKREFDAFLAAHREGIRYMKANRSEATRVLSARFGLPPGLVRKSCDDYLIWMNESLVVDFKQFERLLSQIAPEKTGEARRIASEWISPGALRG